ncbi:MAG: hypothetical protein GY776_19190 [Alteromonas sp.]|nr:hypothetical protein [Alteromonas sp.]
MTRVTKQELERKILDLESEVSRLETIESNYAELKRAYDLNLVGVAQIKEQLEAEKANIKLVTEEVVKMPKLIIDSRNKVEIEYDGEALAISVSDNCYCG